MNRYSERNLGALERRYFQDVAYVPNVVEGKQDFPLRMHPLKIRKNSLFKKCPTYVYSCFPASDIPVGTGKRHVYTSSR